MAQNPSNRFSAERIRLLLVQNGVLFAVIALVVFFAAASPRFLSGPNLLTILLQISELGLLALPVAFLIMQANVDLSVGSAAALASVGGALTMAATGSMWPGILVALAIGASTGLINGVLVSIMGLNSFVVTLGFMSAWFGLAQLLSNGRSISGLPAEFTSIGSFSVFGIRIQIIVLVIGVVAAWWILNHTTRGREILAIGGNMRASQLMGLKVNSIRVSTYVAAGVVAGLVGLMLTAKLGAASPIIGQGWELQALTVVLLGGIAFEGGAGRIRSVLYGLVFVGVLNNGLVILGVSPYVQTMLVGLTLVVAVGLDRGIQQAVSRSIAQSARRRQRRESALARAEAGR
ncbi:ABC transporter permease [Leucobacter sp. CSA1]|uniref:ABC transporter permease n=1 Tax=Leucobacter chromiisoli TaxID=2796471 RepID=A0A934UUY3_9MICO|nr:ABC transporter permease [Leucobacter chromiisoli]MBK0420004.1 ABC transporter permease [Leucobacter chromiisoli]